MDMNDRNLFYRLDARFTHLVPVGLVSDGFRMDNRFGGTVTSGMLAGATMTGVDYFRVRPDGVGVVNARELIEHDGARIAVAIHGYVLPPAGMPVPSPEALQAPDFTWPDVDFAIEALATFETAAPRLAELNRLTVTHTGTANMSTGELVIFAHRLVQPATVARAYVPAGLA